MPLLDWAGEAGCVPGLPTVRESYPRERKLEAPKDEIYINMSLLRLVASLATLPTATSRGINYYISSTAGQFS